MAKLRQPIIALIKWLCVRIITTCSGDALIWMAPNRVEWRRVVSELATKQGPNANWRKLFSEKFSESYTGRTEFFSWKSESELRKIPERLQKNCFSEENDIRHFLRKFFSKERPSRSTLASNGVEWFYRSPRSAVTGKQTHISSKERKQSKWEPKLNKLNAYLRMHSVHCTLSNCPWLFASKNHTKLWLLKWC